MTPWSCLVVQVPSFPTKVAMKLVWVWLGEGEPQGHPGDILKGTWSRELGWIQDFKLGAGWYAAEDPVGV